MEDFLPLDRTPRRSIVGVLISDVAGATRGARGVCASAIFRRAPVLLVGMAAMIFAGCCGF